MPKIALITGVTGQDGAYLSEYLIKKGYIVHGIKRRSSLFNTDRIDHLYQDPSIPDRNFVLHYGDLTDSMNLTRIYQASTSELYGLVQEIPQSERTPFYPRSPYAAAKMYAFWITVNYREGYGMHASNGILFNHESPIRGETFVTRKITRGLSRIVLGLQDCLYLGNLSSQRDWGHAKDYVRAMYLIIQQETPDDYVISTGITTSIREFIRMCGQEIGLTIQFNNEGIDEVGVITAIDHQLFTQKVDPEQIPFVEQMIQNHKAIIKVNPKYFRPTEVDLLIGDNTKARTKLGWKPEYDLPALITDMMQSDLKLMQKELYLKEGGYRTYNYFE